MFSFSRLEQSEHVWTKNGLWGFRLALTGPITRRAIVALQLRIAHKAYEAIRLYGPFWVASNYNKQLSRPSCHMFFAIWKRTQTVEDWGLNCSGFSTGAAPPAWLRRKNNCRLRSPKNHPPKKHCKTVQHGETPNIILRNHQVWVRLPCEWLEAIEHL